MCKKVVCNDVLQLFTGCKLVVNWLIFGMKQVVVALRGLHPHIVQSNFLQQVPLPMHTCFPCNPTTYLCFV